MWREHSRSRRDSWDANTAALTRLHGNSDCREKKLLCKFWKSWFTLRLWFGGEKWPGRWCWVFQGHEFDAGWVLPTFEMGRPSWTSLSLSVLLPNHSSHARLTTLMVIATTLEIRLSLPHSQTWSQPWKVLSAKFCSRCSAHVSDYNPAPPMEGFELQSWRSLTESVGGRGYCCSAARRREEGGGDLCNKHCQRHNGPEGWVLLTKVICLGHIISNTWSNFIFRITTKHQLQNLNRTSSSRLNLNFKIFTKRSFRISTKIQPYNLNQTSVAKYWSNFGLKLKISPDLHKILTKPCAQSLNKKIVLWPNFSL